MQFKIVIVAILILAMIGLALPSVQTVSSIQSVNPFTGSFNLTDTVHGYAVGNLTATQEPGYTYPGQISPMPSKLIIIAQAPGNATLTAYFNDSVVRGSNGLGISNIPFKNQIEISATLPSLTSFLVLTVSAAVMNRSVTFTYQLNVLSVQAFIHYEYTVHNVKYPSISFTVDTLWAYIIVFANVMVAALFMTLYFRPLMWRNKKSKKGDN